MTDYQLSIYQQGKLLGNFQTGGLNPLAALKTMIDCLEQNPDLHFELYQRIEDVRFLMLKDGQMQKLGQQYLYQPCSLDILKEE